MTNHDTVRHSRSPYRSSCGDERRSGGRAVITGCLVVAMGVVVAIPMSGLSSANPAPRTNLVKNPGFEKGLKHWTPADGGRSIQLTTASRSGRQAARLTTRVAGVMSLRDRPNTVLNTPSGARYVASAWVRSTSPGLDVSLRIREVRQQKIPGTNVRVLVRKQTADLRLPDTRWHQLKLEYVPKPGNQLDLGIFAWNARRSSALIVDNVRLVAIGAAGPTQSPQPNEQPVPAPSAPPAKPSTEPAPPAPVPTTAPPEKPADPLPASSTLFGTSAEQGPGENWAQAVARRDRDLGRSNVLRVFYPGLPQAWPGRAGQVNRDVVVSFKADPQQIVAGKHDAQLRSWFAEAPKDRNVFWTYFHEPEDNIERGEFTAAQFRAAWQHLRVLADTAGNPQLKATLILMAWSTKQASGRNWRDYYPGTSVIDVLGWDAYNTAGAANSKTRRYAAPAEIYAGPAAIAKAESKPFGFAEWGSLLLPGDDGSRRAAWIRDSCAEIARLGATFATYFDSTVGGDFRLSDGPSKNALKEAISKSS